MEKIAIIRRNGLGDLLCTWPLIAQLQKKFPFGKISLFVDARNAPLIPYLPPIDEVIILPHRGNKYWNLLRVGLKYRVRGFDIAISGKTSPMKLMNCFLFALGARKRIAVVDTSFYSRLVNAPIQFDPLISKKRHQALKGLQMINSQLQAVPKEFYPKIAIPEIYREKYPPPPVEGEGPLLLLNVSTTRSCNCFDLSRLASIVNHLYTDRSFRVMVIGQKEDIERAKALSEKLRPPHALYFPLNFDAFMVALEACDLYFISDGGVAHIGAALGKKEVVLYGETNPIEWAPLSDKVTTLFHPRHVNELDDETIFQALRAKL